MPISEYTVAFTHRYSRYVFLLIALAVGAVFLYAFNFTTFFGGVAQ